MSINSYLTLLIKIVDVANFLSFHAMFLAEKVDIAQIT